MWWLTGVVLVAASLSAQPVRGEAPTGNTVVTELAVDGLIRSYRLYTPAELPASQPAPLVLAFHGFGMNAASMQRLIQLDPIADREGFLVAYPEGTGFTSWQLTFNAGGVLPPFDTGLPDDVEFTRRLIDDVATQFEIDSGRVFATGFSNGAMMCYRLAAELSDRIVAIAPVAGTQAIPFASPPRAVPVCHFHGTSDTIVPTTGPIETTPPFLTFLPLDETLQTWVANNGNPTPSRPVLLENVAYDATRVTRTIWTDGEAPPSIVLYSITGGGHSWPGSRIPSNPLTGRTSRDIQASELLWDFFAAHPRP